MGGNVGRWRAGMLFGCFVEFMLLTVAVKALAPRVHRMVGTGSETVLWLAGHYWVVFAAWVGFMALAWWLIRIEGKERLVAVLASVAHLFALGAVIFGIMK